MVIDFIERREKGREGKRGRHIIQLPVASHMHPNQGSNLQLGMCPVLGGNLQTFSVWGISPIN